MAFLDEIAAYVHAAGLGTQDVTMFLGTDAILPSGPTDDGPFTILRDTGGTAPSRIQNTAGAATRMPSAQVVAVARSRAIAILHIEALFTLLDGKFNLTLSSVPYISIKARQDPMDIGMDAQERPQYAFNIEVEKKPS